MQMFGRTGIPYGAVYRYGLNGKENDDDVKGIGLQQDYGMRIYDPRVGKFLSVDPLTRSYAELSPYQFASNTPIAAVDIDGQEAGVPLNGVGWSGTQMSNYFDNQQGRKVWLQAMGEGTAIGGAMLVDVYLTKGWLTRTLLMSQAFGMIEHNRANSSEGRVAQDKRFKENLTDLSINLGGGVFFKKLFQGGGVLLSESKKLYNFGAKALGEMGEESLARLYKTIKPSGKGSSMRTSLGQRKPDGIPQGTTAQTTDKLYEAKVGFQQFSGDVVTQVAKDAEMIAQGTVDEITWVFFRSPATGKVGASDQLLQELKKAGIKTEIAGDIPKDIIEKNVIKYGATPKR
jgi:RHS repeat-associated protein